MTKERLSAFADAVLAIIMTILVLGLQKPSSITLQGFWNLRTSFFAYALSFFWLGAMWVNLHNEWFHVKKIGRPTVWWMLIMLFFSSLFPYATEIISSHFNNSSAQGFYGLTVLAITFSNFMLYRSVRKYDSANQVFLNNLAKRLTWGKWDIILKFVGLALAMTIFPPAMAISVMITLVGIVIPQQLKK